jgi:hypothetical protein
MIHLLYLIFALAVFSTSAPTKAEDGDPDCLDTRKNQCHPVWRVPQMHGQLTNERCTWAGVHNTLVGWLLTDEVAKRVKGAIPVYVRSEGQGNPPLLTVDKIAAPYGFLVPANSRLAIGAPLVYFHVANPPGPADGPLSFEPISQASPSSHAALLPPHRVTEVEWKTRGWQADCPK